MDFVVPGLLQRLSQGGYGYYWLKHLSGELQTVWFERGAVPDLPDGEYNAYFGINPSRTRKGERERVTLLDVCAVNCLFAEFDAKDFQDGKGAALEHIRGLSMQPSILIDSGGGYHAYWLLDRTHKIQDGADLQRYKDLQARWVEFVGGDPGAKDLARVLRVPGTYNYKYDPPREVLIVQADDEMPYYLEDFYNALPKAPPPPEPVKRNGNGSPFAGNAEKWLRDALTLSHGSGRNENGMWLAAQLRDDGIPQGEAEQVLRSYQAQVTGQGNHPYTEKEAMDTLKSVYRKPARQPAAGKGRPAPSQPARPAVPPVKPPVGSGNGKNAGAAAPVDHTATPGDAGQPDGPEIDPDVFPVVDISYDIVSACYTLQETGDADLMAALFGGKLVYDHAEGAWYIWRGHYWERDLCGMVYRLVARRVAPQYLNAAAHAQESGAEDRSKDLAKRAAALRNKKRIDNVLFLCARHEDIALSGDEWDADPWLLGCINGVINLRDGTFRAGKPEDRIRAHTEVEWRGLDATCPRFAQFLIEVFGGDAELVAFVARLLGYGVTGLSTEHALPILWGEGRNGKSTLLETLADVLGDSLATSSQADALMDAAKGGDGPKPFIFALRGKRLVWASESNEGRRINAGLVKQLTGGDRLNVRTLHSKPIEFKPTHMLMLLTNHKPHISADDQAIWERLHLVPFTQRFIDNPVGPNDHKRDPKLRDALKAELPGILAWLVRGCLMWQAQGLRPPKAVTLATEEYRSEEDTTGIFISERCVVQPDARVRASELYQVYKSWCMDGGIQPMSQTAFGKQIKRRFPAVASSPWVVYGGIGLSSS